MPDYTISFARSAHKEIERFDTNTVNRVFSKIELLAQNPRPRGCRKLRGKRNLWRISVGQYRVIYAVCDSKLLVDIIAVRHRSKAYRL